MSETIPCTNCGQEFHNSEPACPACGQLLQPATCERHPDRPAEGQCVVCGSPVCDECDGPDTHYACPDHQSIPIIEGWAQVYETPDDIEAQLIRENLRSEGIDAEVLSQRDHAFQFDVGEFSAVRVLVPAYDYGLAQEIVSEIVSGQA